MAAWLAIKAFLRLIPWQAWAALALVLAGLWLRSHWIGVGADRVQADFDAYKAEMVAKTKAAKEAAERAETAQALAFGAIATAHAQEMEHARTKASAVTAGLNAGTVRLRDHWRCASLPPVATGPARVDDAPQRRAESAGRIVGVGAACDARIKALQDILRAERQQ